METKRISLTDIQSFEKHKRAKFVNSLSGFKSANLIGTKSRSGQTNLAIVSSAFHLGADPALMGFIFRPNSVPRHTLENIRETQNFTVNHVNTDIYQHAHQSSARYPREMTEFDACQLSEEYLNEFLAPFVKESHIKFAMSFVREIPIEENNTHLIIARIEDVYLPAEALQEDGYLDIEKAQTVCISSLDSYHETTRLGRLSYAKPDSWPKSLE